MRRINSRGLVAAMESEEEIAAAAAAAEPGTEVVDPVGDNAESLETDLIEVAEDEAASSEQEAAIDEAVEVAEALESISEGLRAAAGAGGLSKEAAHVVGLSLDHLYGRVGISRAVGMPALESFGSTSSRVQATTIAFEDIKEQAKQLWAKIVAAIEKSIQWLKEKFELFFGASGKLKARAEKLAQAASQRSGDAKEAEIDNARLFNALQVAGKVDNPIATAENVKDTVEKLFKGAPARVEKLAAFVASGDDKDVAAFFDALDLGELSVVSNPAQDGFKVKEGFEVHRSSEMPGGKAVVAIIPGKGTRASEDLAASSIGISAFKPNAKAAEGKLKTMSPNDVEKLAKVVAAMADNFQQNKLALIKGNDEKKKLVDAIKKHGNGASGDDAKAAKAARATMSALSKMIDSPVAGGSVYLLNTGKALLDLGEESLKQYAK